MRQFGLLCLIGVISISVLVDGGGFVRNVVDFDKADDIGTDFSLAVDGSGTAHLVYARGDELTGWSLTHCVAAAEEYVYELLPENPYTLQNNPYLAITSTGDFAMSLGLGTEPSSVFGSKADWYDWSYSLLPAGRVCAMALSGSGRPHLLINNSGRLYYVSYNIQTGQWTQDLLDTSVLPMPAGIDCTDDGRVLATYCKNPMSYTIAVRENGGWTFLPGPTGQWLRGSFLPDGMITTAYLSQDNNVNYAVYPNAQIGWIITPTGATSGNVTALNHNQNGVAGIAYFKIESGVYQLYYATNIGGGWTHTPVDSMLPLEFRVRLAFDNTGKPLLAYLSPTSYLPVLKLAGIDLEPYCVSDITRDGRVDSGDFALLSRNWMYEIPQGQSCPADINRNGLVNQEDLYELAALWLWSADESQLE
jgi:hypothetical protein